MNYIRRPIPLSGLEGYSVNEIGEVFARDGVSKISQNKNSRGYMKVSLYVTGVGKRTFGVHRLVALAFVPIDDPTGLDADHIDGDKLNNHYKNLQWLTRAENIAKSFKQGRVNPRKGKLSGKLTGLYLTHEAIAILDKVENKSKFVSDLIVETPTENTPSPKIEDVKTFVKKGQNAQKAVDKIISEATPQEEFGTVKVVNYPEDEPFQFCKHNQVKGLCKKGCK